MSALLIGASPTSALPGPASLSTGFDSDTLFFDQSQVSAWFPRMEQLGSTWVRIPVSWSAIAPRDRLAGFDPANPGDPRYRWSTLDGVVKGAAATRQQIILTLDSPPGWAIGAGAPRSAFPRTWRPNSRDYGTFARAVAKRYSGSFPDPAQPGHSLPLVRVFQAWNEPNLPTKLEPQWVRSRNGWVPTAPAIYRGLLNSLYAAVKAVQPHAYVLTGGLAPYGDQPGTFRMRPVAFLSSLLCLSGRARRPARCPDRAHFDAIDIHPYGLTPTTHASNPGDVSTPDVGRLARVLAVAERTGRVLPRAPKPIWVTEIGWDSSPPVAGAVSVAQQSRYLPEAFFELWRRGVSHVMWFEPRDSPVPAGPFTGAGLFFSNGRPKPSRTAFLFPFVLVRGRRGITTLWGRAPRAGSVTIQVARGKGWRRLLRLSTTRGGIFYTDRVLGAHLTLRAVAGAVTSNTWRTG